MENTREHLIKTSLVLFLQKGYKAVTVSDILNVAGYSKGAFYHYFDSKGSLFQQVVDDFFGSMLSIDYHKFKADTLEGFYKEILIKRAQISNVVNQRLSSFVNIDNMNSNFYYLVFDAARILPDFKEQLKYHLNNQLTAWEAVIKKARASSEIIFSMSDKELAALFVNNSSAIALHNVMLGTPDLINKRVENSWTCLYKEIKKQEKPNS